MAGFGGERCYPLTIRNNIETRESPPGATIVVDGDSAAAPLGFLARNM